MLVGAVSGNFDERIGQKLFHAEIDVNNTRVDAETKAYRKIPFITNFIDEEGIDKMEGKIEENYCQIV